MKIIGANITGSFILNNQDVTTTIQTSNVWSGSVATDITALNAATASLLNYTASNNATITDILLETASLNLVTASLLSYTASQNSRNGTYATTGSNTFAGIQTVNSNLVVTGSITAATLIVQTITSSVDFVTGSTRFGSIAANTHVFTGSMSVTGSVTATSFAGSGASLTSIPNSALNNSTISGIALGSNLATLTIGTGLSGTSYNGSTGVTIANTGVTSNVAGTGISINQGTGAVTITNSGVTSIVAGSGISINQGTGAVTVTNTITNNNQLTNGAGYITSAGTSADSNLLNGISAVNLYNNMGAGHGTRSSFDASTPSYGFGYRYVQGGTNGPGTGGSQYYSWYIGLGSDYPATGGGSYGAMFAVDRNVTTPYLTVRYNENNSFGSWRRMAAGYADNAGNTNSISNSLGNTHTWTGAQNNFLGNGNTGSTNNVGMIVYSTGGNGAQFSFHRSGAFAINMGLDSDNVIRIGGWSASTNRFQMDMSGNLTMAGDVTAFSDARVKENVKTIENALAKTLALRGVSYNRIDSDDKRTKIGVIAQETLTVIPEVVSQDNDGMYNVSYGNITALLIEAIKEQQAQIEELKAKLG